MTGAGHVRSFTASPTYLTPRRPAPPPLRQSRSDETLPLYSPQQANFAAGVLRPLPPVPQRVAGRAEMFMAQLALGMAIGLPPLAAAAAVARATCSWPAGPALAAITLAGTGTMLAVCCVLTASAAVGSRVTPVVRRIAFQAFADGR